MAIGQSGMDVKPGADGFSRELQIPVLGDRGGTGPPFFEGLIKAPAEPGPASGRSGFRKELVDLFVDYFCKESPLELKHLIDGLEKCIILKVLERTGGNQKEAAKLLGIKYTTLNQKVKKYGIRFQRGIQLLES